MGPGIINVLRKGVVSGRVRGSKGFCHGTNTKRSVTKRGRKKMVYDMSWVDSNRTVCIVMHKGRNKDSAIATWKGIGCWMS